MKDEIKSISVFLPAVNEEKHLAKVTKSTVSVLEKLRLDYELIIINDGSTDRTGEIAEEFSKKNPKVRVIHHEKNRGYGAALRSGFYNAKKPWITFIDADGQFDFSELSSFLKTQKETGADMVVGYYRKRAVSTFRKLGSFVWQMIMFALFRFRARDIDCGFKLISREVIKKIPKLEAERGALISTELLVKAKRGGFRWVQIPVSHYPREGGEATGSSMKVIVNSFYDLFRLWKKLR